MPESLSFCPLCKNQGFKPFAAPVFRGQALAYQACANCGFVFQSPRPTAAELDNFYAAEYRQLYQGSAEPQAKDLAVQRSRAAALLSFFQQAQPGRRPKNHLDIGCSAGLLLESFRDGLGSQPCGVEPGDAYRAYAQKRGLQVFAALEALPAEKGPFDLVSLAHVVEHLPDPVGYLAGLNGDWLAPDGLLLVEAPNLYAHESFESAHLSAFSQHTLGETLRQAGFTILHSQAHGQPRSDLVPLYLTVLARPSATPPPVNVRPERGVHLKRRVGLLRRRLLSKLFPRQAWKRLDG